MALAGLVVALSACSSDSPPPRTDVPEPAVSPVPSEAPAGRVVPLAGQPEGLVVDGPTRTISAGVLAYVTLTTTNRVQAFRLDGQTPKTDRSWPTLRQPNDVGVDPSTGRIVVAGATDSALQLIDP